MSKRMNRTRNVLQSAVGPIVVLSLTAMMLLHFQNCSASPGFKALDMPSVTETIEAHHNQSDFTLPGEEKLREETTYEPLLADRIYLKALLEDIFGPTVMTVDSARIFVNASDFGAPCSIYEDYSVLNASGTAVAADAMKACGVNSTAYTTAQINPKGTVLRQALLARMCSDVTANAATLRYAMTRILQVGGTGAVAPAIPQAIDENIVGLFGLFYRYHPAPEQRLVDSLLVMFPNGVPDASSWASVIYTVCASSHWQVL